ncbi:hypothetical protein [Streptomyces sp. WAC 04229]|uniref:hypothetical protein n=1 Tax=Streptomyces sp. WAC 04229 TaxID=2203206 RepID=UPI003D723F27
MPIRPEDLHRYPRDWNEISPRIRFERAGGRCECIGKNFFAQWIYVPHSAA